eukprot:CAMPEP_0185572762 /NCGR_PEP_ID=MMETSP0434-20130131/4633_1 /TAXON_ID=626734 ORGANISM="Favella taraikaensis, Strain Fe Narragansett Bay" /NCGR_SAMPLE_ID=MMETSP0434 /ASSEMBLY_ACC=CAM_ASM_000379 /LENGTH=183 /DNA_ID=CAMNT_0028188749 /DNA_START=1204 /DNA_END=1756 /DNA_ORIENTATION=+
MKQEANALKCQQETECQAFLQPHRTNVILGFILVFLNVTAKFFFLAFFFFMLGGMQMLIADMEERDRERNEKASIEAQRRLRTDSFQNIIAELQRSSEQRMNARSACATSSTKTKPRCSTAIIGTFSTLSASACPSDRSLSARSAASLFRPAKKTSSSSGKRRLLTKSQYERSSVELKISPPI